MRRLFNAVSTTVESEYVQHWRYKRSQRFSHNFLFYNKLPLLHVQLLIISFINKCLIMNAKRQKTISKSFIWERSSTQSLIKGPAKLSAKISNVTEPLAWSLRKKKKKDRGVRLETKGKCFFEIVTYKKNNVFKMCQLFLSLSQYTC